MLNISPITHARHSDQPQPSFAKTCAAAALGLLATASFARTVASASASAPAPTPLPLHPSCCPALSLPCACVAAPPPVPTAPIGQQGTPEVFVTTPSPFKDEGVRVILAQRPQGSNATNLFAFNCIDSLGDNALSSVNCVDMMLDINQTGMLSPVDALAYAIDPTNNIANGPNQVLLDYTVALKKIYDAPCTHSNLAQGLAYNLDANDICGMLGEQRASFNDIWVVTHFQEALRDALNEPVPSICFED